MGMLAGVVVLLVFLYVIILGISVASYVMCAIGYQGIAKKRGVKCPWLAWIPYANWWLMGSIADEYDERNGLKKRWAKAMLIICILMMVAMMPYMMVLMAFGNQVALWEYAEPAVSDIIPIVAVLYGVLVIYLLVAVVANVISCICLYKIYESTVPNKALKYVVLSILVPLANGVCLLKCRNEGYSCDEQIIEENIPESIEQEEIQQD